MSKDMLGPATRAAVGVPQDRLELLARIASDLAHDNPQGENWHTHYAAVRAEGLPNFGFERNEHGHVLVTFIGLDLTGAQEIVRLKATGYRVGDYARSCFTSVAADGYDTNHRLVAGQPYKVAIVPGKEIPKDRDRTTANLQVLGLKYGYGRPLGGHIPRIREVVSDNQMKDMGILYIASLHEPIKDSGGDPGVLYADRHGDGRWVGACWVDPGGQWFVGGAFAFPVPAN